jgi:transcriptional regulator with XRE-family HTH domain
MMEYTLAPKVPDYKFLKMVRIHMGMSQAQFGEFVQRSKPTIISWENRQTAIPSSILLDCIQYWKENISPVIDVRHENIQHDR